MRNIDCCRYWTIEHRRESTQLIVVENASQEFFIIQMATHHTNQQEHFRQTGKFKPIQDHARFQHQLQVSSLFQVSSLSLVETNFAIAAETTQYKLKKMWRLYFQGSPTTIDQQVLIRTIENVFEHLAKSELLQQNLAGDLFFNVCNILVQRVKPASMHFITSYLDYNCVIVTQDPSQSLKSQLIYLLDCYQVAIEVSPQEKQFHEEIFIEIKAEFDKFYLLNKNKTFFIVKDLNKQMPILELNEQNLEESAVDIPKNIFIIKNISTRVISLKFLQNNYSTNAEPLRMMIANCELYQTLLFKVNRIKYAKYKTEEQEGKQWHSFDHKTQVDSKKQSKTTPQKSKNNRVQMPSPTLYKATNKSTNNLQIAGQHPNKKNNNKVLMMNNQRNMKISQRVVTNPKESNLVPSQLDYPVSVKDEKQKQSGYFDQFQNLLYEQEVEEKQLALNDSFQEFEKKENSVKQQEIINGLNKRKAKENQDKKMLDSLKQKIKLLINEEKEWINKNFKLKIQIKKIKNNEGKNESNKELEDVKEKINELKKYQKSLIKQLNEIRSQNNLQVLVFDSNSTPQSSQRAANEQNKIFQSCNAFSPNSLNNVQLTTSIRSNDSPNSPTKAQNPFVSPTAGSKSNNLNLPYNFKPAQQRPTNFQNPNLVYTPTASSGISLYSSLQGVPGLLVKGNNNNYNIANNTNSIGNSSGMQGNQVGNEYFSYQTRNPPNQSFINPMSFINKPNPPNNYKKIYPQYNSNIKKV